MISAERHCAGRISADVEHAQIPVARKGRRDGGRHIARRHALTCKGRRNEVYVILLEHVNTVAHAEVIIYLVKVDDQGIESLCRGVHGEVYRYLTLEYAVLQAGEAFVDVLVESEAYGAETNAGAGQICELVTPVSGIDRVGNTSDWLTDEAASDESDEQLRIRYMYAWLSRAGVTSAAYQAAALSVKGCIEAAVADQHPRGEGTIDVIVRGSAGIPTQNLLDAVEEAVNTEIVINHDLLVKGPTAVEVAVQLELELYSGDEAALKLSAENFVRAMFSGDASQTGGHVPFGIGHDVIRDRLAAGIITQTGVKRIVWGGSGDVVVPADGLAVLKTLTVTAKWVSER